MIKRITLILLILCMSLSTLKAHPHIIVFYKIHAVFNEQGEMIGVKHAWTFDKGYSAFLAQGLDANKDKKLSKEELAPMAKTNVDSLNEFEYFTYATLNNKTLEWLPPKDEFMIEETQTPQNDIQKDDPLKNIPNLTLHFFLPLKTPVNLKGQTLNFRIIDKTFLVAFVPADKDTLTLGNNHKNCKAIFQKPQIELLTKPIYGNESQFADTQKSQDYASRFLATTAIACP